MYHNSNTFARVSGRGVERIVQEVARQSAAIQNMGMVPGNVIIDRETEITIKVEARAQGAKVDDGILILGLPVEALPWATGILVLPKDDAVADVPDDHWPVIVQALRLALVEAESDDFIDSVLDTLLWLREANKWA